MDNYEEIAKQAQFVPMTTEQAPKAKDAVDAAGGLPVGSSSRAEVPGAGAPIARRLTVSRRRYGETAVKVVLLACASVSVLTTIGIVVALAEPDHRVLPGREPRRLLHGHGVVAADQPSSFGVLPLVVGTLSATLWACVVAIPFGLGAAIYMSEYARPRIRTLLKPALEVLAGIPTVVYGYFALTVVTPFLQDIGIDVHVFNVLSAGLVMGIMILPHDRVAVRRRDDGRSHVSA